MYNGATGLKASMTWNGAGFYGDVLKPGRSFGLLSHARRAVRLDYKRRGLCNDL